MTYRPGYIGQNHYDGGKRMTAEISSDGRTVWVNSHQGMCIGRFSKHGIDVHYDYAAQAAGSGECIACTHEKPGMVEWDRFVSLMHEHYRVKVLQKHRPKFLGRRS